MNRHKRQPAKNDLKPEASILELDQTLYELVGKINILDGINPLNYAEQKQAFFACNYSSQPQFSYQHNPIDPFKLKRQLFNLPIDNIVDDDLQQLYLAVVDSYVDKIDQFKSIGSREFLYDSLRYYGEPSDKDIRNANFILHLPEEDDTDAEIVLNADDLQKLLEEFADQENYQCNLKIDNSMIANALVSEPPLKLMHMQWSAKQKR